MDETELLRRSRRIVEEGWNRGDTTIVDALFAPDVVDHAAQEADRAGVEGVKAFMRSVRAAMADLETTIVHEAARGDIAMQHVVIRGTHTGPLFGLPATSNPVRFELADIYRFEDTRVVEHWSLFDTGTLLRQLGAVDAEPSR